MVHRVIVNPGSTKMNRERFEEEQVQVFPPKLDM